MNPDRRRGPADHALHLATAGLLLVAANRAVGPAQGRWLVGAQAVTRWGLLPAHLLLPVALVRRRRTSAVVLAALAGYQAWLARSARGRHRPEPADRTGVPVRLVSANLLLTNDRIEEAGRRLLAAPVDVLALQELTPDHLAALERDGLRERLPYALTAPRPGFHGAGLFARWPLSGTEVVDLDGVPMPVATVQAPDGPLRVAVVHLKNPGAVGQLACWRRQLDALATLTGASTVPVVLVGDFNATADHRDFRRLLRTGLRDAWDVAGRGTGASWPASPGPLPLLMRLGPCAGRPGDRGALGGGARHPRQ